MISLSSHVLDTTSGKPASNMRLVLTLPNGGEISGVTNNDGRFSDWGNIEFSPGIYSLRFHCKEYLLDNHGASFYPHIDISFEMLADTGHHHVPLLLSPFGYSSYRGS